jgi:hypothetical protein
MDDRGGVGHGACPVSSSIRPGLSLEWLTFALTRRRSRHHRRRSGAARGWTACGASCPATRGRGGPGGRPANYDAGPPERTCTANRQSQGPSANRCQTLRWRGSLASTANPQPEWIEAQRVARRPTARPSAPDTYTG